MIILIKNTKNTSCKIIFFFHINKRYKIVVHAREVKKEVTPKIHVCKESGLISKIKIAFTKTIKRIKIYQKTR